MSCPPKPPRVLPSEASSPSWTTLVGPKWTVPGPPPTGPFEFIYIPTPKNQEWRPQGVLHLPMQNNYDWANSPEQLVERSFLYAAVYGERKDLIDRSRVYRVALQYLHKFRYDAQGAYVGEKPHALRFVVNDPSTGTAVLRDWYPLD